MKVETEFVYETVVGLVPKRIPPPVVIPDSRNGRTHLVWDFGLRRFINVEIVPTGYIYWEAVIENEELSGSFYFDGKLQDEMLNCILRIYVGS